MGSAPKKIINEIRQNEFLSQKKVLFFFSSSSLPAIYRYNPSDPILTFYYKDIFPYIIPSVYSLGLIAQTGSIYSTLCVTIERYIVICWPLR